MITRDDWLAALAEAERQMPEQDPAWLTVKELEDVFEVSNTSAKRKAERLVELGLAELGSKWIRLGDGSLRKVPAYRLKERSA